MRLRKQKNNYGTRNNYGKYQKKLDWSNDRTRGDSAFFMENLEKLKAKVYDLLVTIELSQKELQKVNAEILKINEENKWNERNAKKL